MSPYSDAEMAQLDRAAERRERDEAFRAAHPEYSDAERNALIRQDLKQRARRFTGAAVTGFGELTGGAS